MELQGIVDPAELNAHIRAALRFAPLYWAQLENDTKRTFSSHHFRFLLLVQLGHPPIVGDQEIETQLNRIDHEQSLPHHDVLRIHSEFVSAARRSVRAFATALKLQARERLRDYGDQGDSSDWISAANEVIHRVHAQEEQLWIEAEEACRIAREENQGQYFSTWRPGLLRELFDQDRRAENDLTLTRIWPDPADIIGLWKYVRGIWTARGAAWSFWIDWYEDALAGRPPDWALLKEIALLPDDLWAAGAEAVGERIDAIRDKHRMRRIIAEIRSSASAFAAGGAPPELRGHNNPPELIADGLLEARQGAAELVPLLAAAEVELAKPVPIASTLERIAKDIKALVANLGQNARTLLGAVMLAAAAAAGADLGHWIAAVASDPHSLLALAKALRAIAAQWLEF